MRNELVSIIIPIYNAENTIEKCIESIINQTYSNIEIILINDGSSDDSQKICEKYAQFDDRIRIINQVNSGVSSARNNGIKISSGRYIQFVDSDDYIEENMTYSLVKFLEDTNSEFAISGIYNVEENFSVCSREDLYKKVKNLFGEEIITSVWNKMFLKEKIKSHFDTNINYGEDIIFNLKYLEGVQRIVLIKEKFYHYQHVNPMSLTVRYNAERLKMSEEVYLNECKYIELYNWNSKGLKKQISYIYMKNIIYGLYMEQVFNSKNLYSKILIWSEKQSVKHAMKDINHLSIIYLLALLLINKMKISLKFIFYILYKIRC